ncbi:hypothetical protein [Pseudoxanthomonas putridarboris]|uniref:Uncharacterized protein n=1 Tax=Pseudoxanthomonas putridarboris TaxID=752605 RepID=A0ABU9J1Y5_9GAMM
MPSYLTLSIIMVIVSLLTQVIFLGLQGWAWRRFRHVSFLLLAVSTVFAIADSLLLAVPYVRPMPEGALAGLMLLSFLPLAHAIVLGVWGTYALFRAYGRLADENVRLRQALEHAKRAAAPAAPLEA